MSYAVGPCVIPKHIGTRVSLERKALEILDKRHTPHLELGVRSYLSPVLSPGSPDDSLVVNVREVFSGQSADFFDDVGVGRCHPYGSDLFGPVRSLALEIFRSCRQIFLKNKNVHEGNHKSRLLPTRMDLKKMDRRTASTLCFRRDWHIPS